MNKKGNNPWILCPSKSFPGKLYYFNVITGEAAWCLTEDEKKFLAKDVTIKKVSDKDHCYPEPSSPPADDGADMSNMFYNFTPPPTLPMSYQMGPVPMFSQPVFSRYIPNQYMPGYMIPMPQMYMPSKPEAKKRSFDQITQTSDIQVPCIQTCTIPLSKRFGTYGKKSTDAKIFGSKGKCLSTQYKGDTFSTGNWCDIDSPEINFNTVQGGIFGPKLIDNNEVKPSTSKHSLFHSDVNNTAKTNINRIIKDPVLTSDRRENIDRNFLRNRNQKTDIIKKPVLIQETDKVTETKPFTVNSATNTESEFCLKRPALFAQSFTVNKEPWVPIIKSDNSKEPIQKPTITDKINETEDNIDNDQNQLGNNDLRYVLQAKKRKLKPSNTDSSAQTKDIFTSAPKQVKHNDLNQLKDKVKQVRFDLENLKAMEDEETFMYEEDVQTLDSENVVETYSPTPQTMNILYLKGLAKPFSKTDPWYIVVDIGVLLNDFEFIEDFVKKDSTCRLLVPNSVRSYIETMSVGEYGGRSWVMMARKAMRRLKTLENIVVLQPPITETISTSAIDGTLECCLQILERSHAVLITTETELYTKALASGIHTFKLDDIKQSVDSEPQFTFDRDIETQNDNIFMQSPEKFEVFPLSKNVSMVDNNSNIFKVPTIPKEREKKTVLGNKLDDRKPSIFDSSDIVTTTSNKIKLIRKKDNVKEKVEMDIEDELKMLSLHEITLQNNKLSDNFKGIPQRYLDLNVRKVIVNTEIANNGDKNEKNLEKSKLDQRRIFETPVLKSKELEKLPESYNTFKSGMKVKPLTITVSGKSQTNLLQKEGNRLKINAYNLEDSLKKFQVKNAEMRKRIESRLDEWACWFYQIIEDCLSDILINTKQEPQKKLTAPWSLLEAVLCVKEVYSNDTAIRTVAEKLCTVLSDLSDNNDNLSNKIKAVDFMKLFGCGALLIESLKTALPNSAQVLESQENLNTLLQHMQDPSKDIELPFTPMRVVQSEMEEMETLKRNIVLKKPSDIIQYLKIHFPAWKDFDERNLPPEVINKPEKDIPKEPKIVRTFGKNLNSIRLNHSKKITFDEIHDTEFKENIEHTQKNFPNITRTVRNIQKDIEKVKEKDNTKDIYNKDLNKLTNVNDKTSKHNKETSFRLWNDSNDKSMDDKFEMRNDNISNVMVELDDNATPFNEVGEKNDVINDISLFDGEMNDKIQGDKDNCDSLDDSGYVNQSLDACSFIRLFLMELSSSFKLIYTFIDENIREFRCNGVQQKDKKILYDKANETHLYVADIIGKLKRIIEREASENTKLKSLIISAGVEALTDKRMTRYRQVTMKCLEQAQLLEGALKTMLALTNEHCDITTVNLDNTTCHVPYFNIFE